MYVKVAACYISVKNTILIIILIVINFSTLCFLHNTLTVDHLDL